jgi:uncharacterized SAM-binding protein YcdF (DUF218 family)
VKSNQRTPTSILSNKQQHHERQRLSKAWAALIGVAALIAVAYATRQQTLPWLGQVLDVGVEATRVDYAMLLNGDVDTRAFAVADLYRKGKANRILITSIQDKPRQTELPVHEVARLVLVNCGVPENRIDFVDSRCRSTFDEAQTLLTFMQQHPEATFSVVTNTYHTRRTRWILNQVLGHQMSQVQMVSAQTDGYSAANWWKHEDGFTYYISEFFKSSFYWVRYGSGLTWIAAALTCVGLGWWIRHRRCDQNSVPTEFQPATAN